MTFWQLIAITVTGAAFSMTGNYFLTIHLVHRKRREQKPDEDISQLQRDMVVVRGQIKYIQGILNGKHWKRQED